MTYKVPSMPRRRPHTAFTLIELLVVIAIIAILASILFPVFGRARENARRASCQSNMKQVGLGLVQYNQDYDEKMPFWFYSDSTDAVQPRFTWTRVINPYVKSYDISLCPNKTKPVGSNSEYTKARWPAYGFNYIYLNANGCAVNAAGTDYLWKPINISRVAQPAATVAFTEIKVRGNDSTGSYILNPTADVPGAVGASEPDECDYSDGGWGTGSFMDDGSADAGPITHTGSVQMRHFDGANVAYVDGHVKWLTPGRMAAGTNWRLGIANSAVNITDMSQFIWDYR